MGPSHEGARASSPTGTLAALCDRLSWAVLEFEIEAVDPIELPEYPGSTLRGVFGRGLRALACLAGRPPCERCLHPEECLYQRIFESRTPPGAEVLSANSHVSPPFALLATRGRRLAPRERFAFGVTLVGAAAQASSYVVEAFRRAGSSGIGRRRGRFRLALVRAVVPGGGRRLLYDGATGRAVGEAPIHDAVRWGAPALEWGSRALDLEFVTPTDLREGGRPATEPDFVAIARALLRRATTLAHFHCGGAARVDVRPWLEAARSARVLERDLAAAPWRRWSSRQGRWVPMGGVVGRLRLADVPEDFVWLLAAGQSLHLGKGTTSGQGAYRIAPAGEPSS